MQLRLIRDEFNDDCTLGKIYNGDMFCCYSLEDTVREISLPVERWKVKGMTAIPRGRYHVMITFSNRFQKYLPELQDVPGFTGIRIHAGNTSADTEGCILVGMQRSGSRLYDSRVAMRALQSQIEKAIREGQRVWLTVE